MASFKSVPTIATKRDTSSPVKRKPKNEITEEDLAIREPMTEEEADKLLQESLKPLVPEEPKEEPKVEPKKEVKPEPKVEPKEEKPVEEVKEEPKPEPKKVEKKPVAKVVLAPKPAAKKEKAAEAKPVEKKAPKKEEPKPVEEKAPVVEAPKPAPVVEEKPVAEAPKPAEPARPLTPEEKKARLLANLQKGRLAAQEKKAREQEIAARQANTPRKEVAKPKVAIDMSKMTTMAKKPVVATGKTVYHVSKRGETLEDRVWKVFIQESSKVIKLFDTQAEALDYAKGLAKNKADGSYVILHGLDGKIRKY